MPGRWRTERWLVRAVGLVCWAILAGWRAAPAAPLGERQLDAGWRFRLSPDSEEASGRGALTVWRAARVPGNVHLDLLAHGLIPDPHVGAAEAALQWIGLADWEYRVEFAAGPAELDRRHAELVFEGLDTFAELTLNGAPLAATDNMHRTWILPVDGRLRPRNELRIVLRSPLRRLLGAARAAPHPLPGAYPSAFGDEPPNVQTANFARKANYHYGWDWGPRYVTAGVWRPVRLRVWDELRVVDFALRQEALTAVEARLTAELELVADVETALEVSVECAGPPGTASATARATARLSAGENPVAVPLVIAAPRFWYPASYGEPALYRCSARLLAGELELAAAQRRIGLRTVELRRDADAGGRGFGFVVNGIPIFAKGANVIPADSFPARVEPARQRRLLEAARAAHMNVLRLWGGGYYESDAFYDAADELGLLLWQDFMFGGAMPPAYDEAFRANVRAEARDQVRRLRHHPSLLLWCGNNEVETSWQEWGNGKEMLAAAPDFAARVWEGYRTLFDRELRDVVARDGHGVPYWPSSPSADFAGPPNAGERGDRHSWAVWGGRQPVAAYLAERPRFVSEYGLQSWPVLATLARFIRPQELAVDGAVIRAHQKYLAGDGNQRQLEYIRAEYGEPRDFADFVYLGQVMQAEGVELAALHHRRERPRTMGSLYWQLNDVWPGASWSSIDVLGRWKALHFHARRFFAPLAVAALRDGGATRVEILNDGTRAVEGDLRLRLVDFDGAVTREERRALRAEPLSATRVGLATDAELLAGADPRRSAAVYDWSGEDGVASRAVVYFAPARELALADPEIRAVWRRHGRGARLELRSRRLARAVWLDLGELEAELADNAFDLLPGEARVVDVTTSAPLAALRRALTIRSLGRRASGPAG